MALLEANDIMAVTTGESILPHMPFDIKVTRDQAERARRIIADAQVHGAQAADDAERQTEQRSE